MPITQAPFLSVQAAARLSNMTRPRLLQLIEAGVISTVKVKSERQLIARRDLLALLNDNNISPKVVA